ncbi:hypothetical protein GIB67_019439 [Kingdonia uniflora]|uniref:Uncharacterized protein n=1 Tax=Kingdonia uniflora TaxID=39325 RepID=A0A7J7MUE7_9MAGN|nr:hypothetical protein GIB67_019439 [Kingdonia uniflora]
MTMQHLRRNNGGPSKKTQIPRMGIGMKQRTKLISPLLYKSHLRCQRRTSFTITIPNLLQGIDSISQTTSLPSHLPQPLHLLQASSDRTDGGQQTKPHNEIAIVDKNHPLPPILLPTTSHGKLEEQGLESTKKDFGYQNSEFADLPFLFEL